MIREVKAIGSYFDLDENGFLINPSNWSNIPSKWHSPINLIRNAYIEYFQDSLHSLYLRGSLARGTYVEGVSDVDFIGLVKREAKWEHVSFEKDLEEELKTKFSFISDLELMISAYSKNLMISYPALAMILKTQAICIYGKDIGEELPHFKPGIDLLLHFKWIDQDVKEYLKLKSPSQSDNQLIMKMLIRCGFELLIEKEKTFTLDLYPAVQSFKKHYPEYAGEMDSVLHFYLNPFENLEKQRELIVTFGVWLVKEVDRLLK